MDIQELIERIIATTPQGVNPQFTFILLDGQAKRTQVKDYFGLLHQDVKNMFGVDDAIAFLFDRDLFLWKVEEVEFNAPAVPQLNFLSRWRITLKKEDK